MSIELKVPAVGESITEVQIGQWLKAEGDHADQDENLVEIETDKATVELPAPVSGRIAKVLKRNGDTAAVGEVIGYMEESAPDEAHQEAAAAAQAQAADMIRTPAKRQAESQQGGAWAIGQRPAAPAAPQAPTPASQAPAPAAEPKQPAAAMETEARPPSQRLRVRRPIGAWWSARKCRDRPNRRGNRSDLRPRRFGCRFPPRATVGRARKKRYR